MLAIYTINRNTSGCHFITTIVSENDSVGAVISQSFFLIFRHLAKCKSGTAFDYMPAFFVKNTLIKSPVVEKHLFELFLKFKIF